jgi:hypothetical protein
MSIRRTASVAIGASGRRAGRGLLARYSRAAAGARDLGLRFLLGLGLFKVLDGQLKLLDQQPAALRGLPVPFAPPLGQHQLQPLDFQAADGHYAGRRPQRFALRKYDRMRGGQIGSKRIGGARHTDESIIFVAKNPARSSSSATNISSSGSLWTPGCLRHPPIDAGQKVRQQNGRRIERAGDPTVSARHTPPAIRELGNAPVKR